MKSFFRFFLTLLLCCALLLPVWAAPADLTLSDAQAAAGEVVYLSLTLNKATRGDTMGVAYSYDSSHLEPIPELCAWSKAGSIKDFGLKGQGVWATGFESTLEGNICVLAFRIKKDAQFEQTTVSCNLVVKSGTEQTGAFTADAKVRIACSHSFADWVSDSDALHSRSCKNCGSPQTEPHQWDQGVTQTDPQDSGKKIKLFTCTGCGATRQEKVADSATEPTVPEKPTEPAPTEPTQPQPTEPSRPQPTEPSRPQPTEPTRPQPTEPSRPQPTEPTRPQPTEPTRPQPTEPTRPQPTEPTQPQPVAPTQPQNPGQSQQDPTGHDQEAHLTPTVPVQQPNQNITHSPDDGHDHSGVIYDSNGNILAIPIQNPQETTGETHSPDDGHDHSDDPILLTETQPKGSTALVVMAVVVVSIGAAIFFVKKKKR